MRSRPTYLSLSPRETDGAHSFVCNGYARGNPLSNGTGKHRPLRGGHSPPGKFRAAFNAIILEIGFGGIVLVKGMTPILPPMH